MVDFLAFTNFYLTDLLEKCNSPCFPMTFKTHTLVPGTPHYNSNKHTAHRIFHKAMVHVIINTTFDNISLNAFLISNSCENFEIGIPISDSNQIRDLRNGHHNK